MKRILLTGLSLVVLLGLLLTACGTAATGTPQVSVVTATPEATANPYDDNAKITVWIDAARKPMADLWVTTHADQASLVSFEIVDRAQFPSKVLLFNNTGSGWPDAVFAQSIPSPGPPRRRLAGNLMAMTKSNR